MVKFLKQTIILEGRIVNYPEQHLGQCEKVNISIKEKDADIAEQYTQLI